MLGSGERNFTPVRPSPSTTVPSHRRLEEDAPALERKWWFRSEEELGKMSEAKRRDFGHISRIMETELGEKLQGRSRCAACQAAGEECWVYSEDGAKLVKKCGSTCARCRVVARVGGCSLSTRRRNRPRSSLPPRDNAALRSAGDPPPGAGGSGVRV